MHKAQQQVIEFHNKFGVEKTHLPNICFSKRLRLDLIEEELKELVDGFNENNLEKVADGLVDLLYVVYGCAISCGIDIEPLFDEVHSANMRKEGGSIRSDGKILKPKNWQKPNIKHILALQPPIL